ncbi:MAG: hypothetical protein LUH10_00170 [Tannerellaceae bacterium]|nr:hypothetical protein [Tannerellaceae bacterium]
MYTENIKNIHGILSLSTYGRTGALMCEWKSNNLIIEEGYTIAAQALAGYPGARVTQIADGTNGTPPVPGDTEITSSVIVDIETVKYLKPGQTQFISRFEYNEAVGKQ